MIYLHAGRRIGPEQPVDPMECGTVIAAADNTILVEAEAGTSCEGCAAASSCIMTPGTAKRRISMVNTLGARVGDRVTFVVNARAVVAGSLLLYLLPPVLLIAGALAGDGLHARIGLDIEGASFLGGLSGLIMSFAVIAAVSRLAGKGGTFSARLVEVVGRGR